jgi:hypothetical protein
MSPKLNGIQKWSLNKYKEKSKRTSVECWRKDVIPMTVARCATADMAVK